MEQPGIIPIYVYRTLCGGAMLLPFGLGHQYDGDIYH